VNELKIYDVYILEAKKAAVLQAMRDEEDRRLWERITAGEGELAIYNRKEIQCIIMGTCR
jgi:hypothetical protein